MITIESAQLDMSDFNQPQCPIQMPNELGIFGTTNLTHLTIKVIGVGNTGCNLLDNLATQHLEGVELIAANTDARALERCVVSKKLLLGSDGLSAGANVDVGRRAACDSREKIVEALKGAHLVFIVASLGAGTGTGAGPVIAKTANELGMFTIGLAIYPFRFEGRCCSNADAGIPVWEKELSSLIVLSNDQLAELCDEHMPMIDVFGVMNQLCCDAIRGAVEILCFPSLVNMSICQVGAAIAGEGTMSSGCACGPNRARIATERALSLQLSKGLLAADARSVLLIITAAHGLSPKEVNHVVSEARISVAPNSRSFTCTAYDDTLGDSIRVSVLAVR